MRIETANKICADVLAVHAFAGYARDMDDLASMIRAHRRSIGLSQAEYGERLGTDQANVSRWEKGSLPKSAMLQKLADLMGRPINDLIGGEAPARVDGEGGATLFLPVTLPSAPALTAMFRAMLVGHEKLSQDEIARRLAQGLADGLRQALGRPTGEGSAEAKIRSEGAQVPATPHPEQH